MELDRILENEPAHLNQSVQAPNETNGIVNLPHNSCMKENKCAGVAYNTSPSQRLVKEDFCMIFPSKNCEENLRYDIRNH